MNIIILLILVVAYAIMDNLYSVIKANENRRLASVLKKENEKLKKDAKRNGNYY